MNLWLNNKKNHEIRHNEFLVDFKLIFSIFLFYFKTEFWKHINFGLQQQFSATEN